ncbi:ribonuclease H2, subunit C [Powellomyces hirtus]|nr:ribonuclease H2, subunit C [Powellomyces hirtus]
MGELITITASSSGSNKPLVRPTLHLLPCQIGHTGPANVSSFFIVTKDAACGDYDFTPPQHAASSLSTTFRGRALQGLQAAVPVGYEGRIYRESAPGPGGDRGWSVEGSFTEFAAWGHDNVPTVDTSDALKMMAWIEIANDIHSHAA